MALMPCRDCGEQISTTAARCPKCGANREMRWRMVWVVIVVILSVVALFGSFIFAWSPGAAMGFIGFLLVITLLAWFANAR